MLVKTPASMGGRCSTLRKDKAASLARASCRRPLIICRYGQDRFAVVPEAGINFGYALTHHIRLTFGYTLLYWSNVFLCR